MKFDVFCHLERSEAESKDPTELPMGSSTGFLDFARNDNAWLVIYPVDFPKALIVMSKNQFSILQLHIPFIARPGFFVPPISGKKIRPVLPNDFAANIRAANVRELVFIQKDGCRHCRPKSSQCRTWHRHPADRMGWKPMPRERLHAKCIRLMRFFQNRRANSISVE